MSYFRDKAPPEPQHASSRPSNGFTLQHQMAPTDNGRPSTSPAFVEQMLWGCCNCRLSGGLTAFIQSCPECQHRTCNECAWEPVKIAIQETLFGHQVAQNMHHIHSHDDLVPRRTVKIPRLMSTTTPNPRPTTQQFSSGRSKHQSRKEREKIGSRGLEKPGRRKQSGDKTRDDFKGSFACHFCKRSPHIYNPWVAGDRYLKCLYPNPSEFRRIKDHLRDHHLLPYFRCQQCYAVFEDEDALLQHDKFCQGCESTREPPCDGVDKNQWKQIGESISTVKNPNKEDEDRWFDIWTILFPGVKQPQSPYSEIPRFDAAAFLMDVEKTVELQYENNCLKRDPHSHNTWIGIIKQALDHSLYMYPKHKTDSASTRQVPVVDEATNVETNLSCEEDVTKADEDGLLSCVATPLEGRSFESLNELIHPNSVKTQGYDSQTFDKNSVSSRESSRPSMAKSPAIQEPSMSTSQTLKHNHAFLNQDSILEVTPEHEYSYNQSEDIMSSFSEFLNTTQGPDIEPPDLESLFADIHSLFPPSEAPYVYNTDFSTLEEQPGIDTDAYIDSHDISGLLAFESALPNSNAPIKDVRDMNKGLKGRYEFDGSM